MEKTLDVTTYFGQKMQVTYDYQQTVQELKCKVISLIAPEMGVKDVDFIYRGKQLKDNNKLLKDVIDPANRNLFANAKGVHGGCYIGGKC